MNDLECKYSLVLVFVTIFFSNTSIACSCLYAGKFSDYVAGDKGVVRATNMKYGPKLSHGGTLYESMFVEVTDVIKGEYNSKELTLLGDPGHLCRDYVNSMRFKIGSEHLISISSEEAIQPLGGCGESSVVIKDGKVEGVERKDNKNNKYSIDLNDLIKLLKDQ